VSLGKIKAGFQLPTVRNLAAATNIAAGTIKHAYDVLELEGLVRKKRGAGSFINTPLLKTEKGSKDQALEAIDNFLDRMEELSFNSKEIRSILELKLKERETHPHVVTIAAVDCNPESLRMMGRQILGAAHTEVTPYLLAPVLEQEEKFAPRADLIVTTTTHYDLLCQKVNGGRRPMRVVMAVSPDTVANIAALPHQTELGVICASERFAEIIRGVIQRYSRLNNPPRFAFFGNEEAIKQTLAETGRIILPTDYADFASEAEMEMILAAKETHSPIDYRYQIERGSFIHLEDHISRLWASKRV
jgi:DNA-binding transcriptional regulator YhcF (GntR family)